jgi:hypothetical protein
MFHAPAHRSVLRNMIGQTSLNIIGQMHTNMIERRPDVEG